MTRLRILSVSTAGLLLTALAFAQQAPTGNQPQASDTQSTGTHVMLMPQDLKWGEAPPGLPKGAKVAVLEGDPGKAGPFTIRIDMPANYKIKPHWHPGIEHVTVISGTFYMGSGEKFDEAAVKKLGPGGFAIMPVKYVHYAMTKGDKATLQLHGMGPWGITYVNAADDPRNPPSK